MSRQDGSSLSIGVWDAPIVNLGLPDAYPTPTNATADMSYGVSSVLYDNLWGTNYVMWCVRRCCCTGTSSLSQVALPQELPARSRRGEHPVPLYAVLHAAVVLRILPCLAIILLNWTVRCEPGRHWMPCDGRAGQGAKQAMVRMLALRDQGDAFLNQARVSLFFLQI